MSILAKNNFGDAHLAAQLFEAGMRLRQADAPRTLNADEIRDLGETLVTAARTLRRSQATVKALTDELLEEQALATSGAVIPLVREVV